MPKGASKPSSTNQDFFRDVFAVVRLIPRGRVSTYGAIANYLGSKRGARMVGWAMNQSHGCIPQVPAHRVVNRIGLLTGKHHFSDAGEMQRLLEREGLKVLNDQVQNFDKYFWDPCAELL